MECLIAFEINAYEERINQNVAFDQNFQPSMANVQAATAYENHEIAVTKPEKKAALKKQTSFGRVLIAANKAVNPILAGAGLMTV